MPTHQEIVDDANIRRNDIIDQEKAIQRQIGVVSHGKGRTKIQDLQALTDTDISLINAREMLDLVTLQALDQTAELAEIRKGLKAAVKNLTAKTAQIAKFGTIAQDVTKVLGGLDSLTTKIQAIAAEQKAAKIKTTT